MNIRVWDRLTKRQRKGLAWAAALFVAYSLVGFLLLPWIIRWQAHRQLPALLKREVSVRQVRVNPWTLSLTVRGLAVREPDDRLFLGWDEFHVNFQASSLFRWAWTFKEIRLVDPFGEVILDPDGRPNFANLIPAPSEEVPEASSGPPRVIVDRLSITNGVFAFEDHTRRSVFRTEYRPVNVRLNAFRTTPEARNPYSFEAENDSGKRIAWSGQFTVRPLHGAGVLEVNGVDLARYHPYLEDLVQARLAGGMADLHLEYLFESGDRGSDLVVSNGMVRVRDLRFEDPTRADVPVGLRTAQLEGLAVNLKDRMVRAAALELDGLEILARIDQGGALNLVRLFRPLAPETDSDLEKPGEASPAWVVGVDELKLGASVAFEDMSRPTPFHTLWSPIELQLDLFSTRTNAATAYQFSARSDTGESAAGSGTFSLIPLASTGVLNFGAFGVGKYAPYFEHAFHGRFLRGHVGMEVPYQVALLGKRLQAGVTNLMIKVEDLALAEKEGTEPVMTFALFEVEGVAASLSDRNLQVGRVHSEGGALDIRRAEDGRINLLSLMPERKAAADDSASASEAADDDRDWAVGVDAVSFADYSVNVRDESLATPAQFNLDHMELGLKGLSSDGSKPVETQLALRLNESGGMNVSGTAVRQPVSATFDVAITNLDLSVFGPYVEPHARLGVAEARLDLDGQARFERIERELRMGFQGGLRLRDFLCTDLAMHEPLVGWDELSLAGIRLTNTPPSLAVERMDWRGLAGHLIVDEQGAFNVSQVLVRPETPAVGGSTEVEPRPGAGDEPVAIAVGELTLDAAAVKFLDRSIQPEAALDLGNIHGTIRGISSEAGATAEVDISAEVEQSPLRILGNVNPLATELTMDLAITNQNLQLAALSPYMEKYGGYPLNRGRLTVALRYRVQQNEVTAENHFLIEQLTLGGRNDSPDATSLPIKLGIALLKDREGRIDLDIPIEGRLDDPTFRVGPLIGKVVINMITKAAASPFNVLGALVGGGEELSYIEFQPGTTNVVDGEMAKLEKLVRALEERPALNVDLEGAVDPARDGPVLRLAKLREQIRAHRLKELEVRGDSMASAHAFVMDPVDYSRLLRLRYESEVGDTIDADAVESPSVDDEPAEVAEPGAEAGAPRRRRGWFRGALSVLGLGRSTVSEETATGAAEAEAPVVAASEPTEESMETRLAQRIELGPEDYARLIQARTHWVRDQLTIQGGLAGDRLFLVAPKPVDESPGGQCRVELLLN